MASDARGMRGIRSRTSDGTLRQKRKDTHAGTIEDKYKVDFGVRRDMHLETLLKLHGKDSLNDLINDE